jgi:hypothetical protein
MNNDFSRLPVNFSPAEPRGAGAALEPGLLPEESHQISSAAGCDPGKPFMTI